MARPRDSGGTGMRTPKPGIAHRDPISSLHLVFRGRGRTGRQHGLAHVNLCHLGGSGGGNYGRKRRGGNGHASIGASLTALKGSARHDLRSPISRKPVLSEAVVDCASTRQMIIQHLRGVGFDDSRPFCRVTSGPIFGRTIGRSTGTRSSGGERRRIWEPSFAFRMV